MTAPLEGEPVCADFEIGAARTKFKGALRRPVRITVLDGSTIVSERIALGKRDPADRDSLLVVEDDDETYTVRFAQCQNPFAPQRVDADPTRRTDARTAYDCGDSTVYKEIQLSVKEADPSSRRIPWQPPPEPGCAEGAGPAPDASATDASAAPSAPHSAPHGAPSHAPAASARPARSAGGG